MSKKILLWTSSYPPVLGGLQTLVSQLAEGLTLKGYEVLVLSNRYPLNLKTSEVINNVKIRRILHFQKETKGIKGVFNNVIFPFQKCIIENIIKAFCPNVINIHFPDAQLPYIKGIKAVLPNTKWVVSFHGHDILRYLIEGEEYDYFSKNNSQVNSRKYQQLEHLLKFCSSITSCSKWLSDKVKVVFPSIPELDIIYNAVDTIPFETIAEHKEQSPYLFSFGRLDPCKGFEMLIKAYSVLKKQSKPELPILIIAGEGIDRKKLETLIKSEHLIGCVLLPGRMNKNEIIAYTKGALINIIPSLRETFGIGLLEAMSSMRPVLSSNRGGLAEAGGNLVTYFEPKVPSCEKQLKNMVFSYTDLIKNPELIKEHLSAFTLETMVEKYEASFQI